MCPRQLQKTSYFLSVSDWWSSCKYSAGWNNFPSVRPVRQTASAAAVLSGIGGFPEWNKCTNTLHLGRISACILWIVLTLLGQLIFVNTSVWKRLCFTDNSLVCPSSLPLLIIILEWCWWYSFILTKLANMTVQPRFWDLWWMRV